MNTIQQIKVWSSTHHPRWLIIIRIGLGLFLFAKGINFMRDSQMLESLIYGSRTQAENETHWLPILITWAHLLGGFFLMIGLMTRFIALTQIPILIGAIVFLNKSGGATPSDLGLAILTLLLLIFFLIEGSGPISLDAYFASNRDSRDQGRNLP